ncbi:pilus assembly protein Flp/PilA [Paraburkholderia sp. UCT70]|uniref:Flp family type IVb pilin n=1 Tax=Paraburkholderia sp. UCT70 TaxID=2991068 RepID=UPI003D192242
MKIRQFVKKFARDERGVTALEYAILAGIIVGAVVLGVGYLSGALKTGFGELSTQIGNATTAAS